MSILEFEKILYYQQNNRTELGSITTQNSPPKHLQDYCKLISSVVERPEDGKLHEKSVQLSLQGRWNRWCVYIKLNLYWKNLIAVLQPLLPVSSGATYGTLPSLSNLCRWHIGPEIVCFLCSKQVCTLADIFGACRFALQQGRFTFHHNAVLLVLSPSIKSFYQKPSQKPTADCYIVHQIVFFCLILS